MATRIDATTVLFRMPTFKFIIATCACALLASTAVADAHVKVYAEPGWTTVTACSTTEYLVFVPNERPDPTVRLDLVVPTAVTVIDVLPVPGWTFNLTRTKGRVTGISWSGSQINPQEYQRFAFMAAAPASPQTLSWNANQTYQNGEVVHWTGAPNSDTPHSQIVVTPAPSSAHCGSRPRR